MKRFIPSYRNPDPTDSIWLDWIDQAARTQGAICINPNSGPGAGFNPSWGAIVDSARHRGVLVFGYVALGRGETPLIDVVRQCEAYMQWYRTDGPFLDECPTAPGARRHVALLVRWAMLGRLGQRPQWCCLNPGTALVDPNWYREVPKGYAERLLVCTSEGTAPGFPQPGMPPVNQVVLLYGQGAPEASMASLAAAGWKWGWATPDEGRQGNPWNGDPND